MKTASPLRYPGGKSSISGLLSGIRSLNGLGARDIAEPFAGGAGASLCLLYLEDTYQIHINDADPGIHDFWWTLVHRPRPFLELLRKTPVSMTEWRRQRSTYRQGSSSRLRRGFATFYLNRCNHSGIVIDGGPIGGIEQKGKWKIGARFNREELMSRCERVSRYSSRIRVTELDGCDFIESLPTESTFFFIDPPYYRKGPLLYLNGLDARYHGDLADRLRGLGEDAAWVLTYDDCPEIRALYEGWASIRSFSLRYSARIRQIGREVMITPPWMRLPATQKSGAVVW